MTASEPAPASRKALRWEEHKERTRRELIDAARRLFAERGFDATSAADIAAAAGVTERTLFRYFPNKSALVLDEVLALMPRMLQQIAGRPAGEGPYQAVLEGVIEFWQQHQDLLRLLFASGPVAPSLPISERQRPLIELEQDLADVLRQRYAVPDQDQVSPAVWARASIGALRTAMAVAAQNRPPGTAADPDADAKVGQTVRASFAALVP